MGDKGGGRVREREGDSDSLEGRRCYCCRRATLVMLILNQFLIFSSVVIRQQLEQLRPCLCKQFSGQSVALGPVQSYHVGRDGMGWDGMGRAAWSVRHSPQAVQL